MTSGFLLWTLGVALGVALGAAAVVAVRAYLRFRGRRVITCPENLERVGVEIDAVGAAVGALGGRPHLRLSDCSRWPEKQGCGQECLAQIEAAPEECLLRRQVSRWYAGRRCRLCGREFGEIAWAHHRPALLGAERELVEWKDVPAQALDEVLATHEPICWDCLVLESVRRRYPERMTYRKS